MKCISYACFISLGLLSFSANSSEIYLQPTEYLGPRNNNPYLQSYFGTVYEGKSDQSLFLLHYESELIGTRHDFTLDLDRAYFRSGDWVFGRAHLWELTGFNAEHDLWGMLAQFEPINLGIQLHPILLGPLGVHYIHEFGEDTKVGFSFSPLAVPNLGSEVSLSESSVSTNRFGRLPPGSVVVNGTSLPVRYQIDTGNIFTDVLLKPNVSGIFIKRLSPVYQFAVGGSFAPDPNPTANVASSFVQVASDDIDAVAVVHPTFDYRVQGYVSNQFKIPDADLTLEGDYLVRSDSVQALEIIARFRDLFFFAYSQSFPATLYLDHLLRAGLAFHLPKGFSFQTDIKTQLNQSQSIWLSGTLDFKPMKSKIDFYLACDLFSGAEGTYFGEWRTNDRAYGGMVLNF